METSVYLINKGVNRCVEFKGLKAQYIWYLGGGLAGLLLLFAAMYIIGVNMYVCVVIILIGGIVLFKTVYRFSNKYGEHGLLKKAAQRKIPRVIKCHSRTVFCRNIVSD
jgi:hypothetical protein